MEVFSLHSIGTSPKTAGLLDIFSFLLRPESKGLASSSSKVYFATISYFYFEMEGSSVFAHKGLFNAYLPKSPLVP